MSVKKGTNDQQHIMDAIDREDYDYVWEQVKYIGFKIMPDIMERYIAFGEIVQKFDTTINNNFIKFYTSNLQYKMGDKKSGYITPNKKIKHSLICEDVSPTDDRYKKSKILQNLKGWNN